MSTATQATSTRSHTFRDYSRDHSGPTAVAIDQAIRRVLEDRRRAKADEPMADETEPTPSTYEPDEAGRNPGETMVESAGKWRSYIRKKVFQMPKAIKGIARKTRTVVDRAISLIGPAGTFERGFILTAGAIVVTLTFLHLVGQTSPLYGIAVSGLIFAGSLAPALRRGVEMKPFGRGVAESPVRNTLTCIMCAPIFTWLAGSSMGRTRKAAICTSWAGILAGTAALITSM